MPAFATPTGTGITPIIIFHNGDADDPAPKIVWAHNNSVVAPDIAYDWAPIDGNRIPADYTFDGNGLKLRTVASPPPAPLPAQLINDCANDQAILATDLTTMLVIRKEPLSVRQNLWSKLKSNNAASTEAVETHAAEANIPLI